MGGGQGWAEVKCVRAFARQVTWCTIINFVVRVTKDSKMKELETYLASSIFILVYITVMEFTESNYR